MARQLNWILATIVIAVLALVSISPFLTETMPLTDDGNLHVYRSIVLDDAIRDGAGLYPRYVSGLAYGYGASLFNYFPPTSYYPILIFHALGLTWVTAWKATMILYVFLAGLGTWLWAKQWVDDVGAYIAVLAYLYAPYTLFDTVTRGSSNEFAGMALLPFALWGFTRLARFGRRGDYLLAIISYALFIMAHNVMTLYGSLLLVAYCGLLILNSEHQPRTTWRLGTAGVFAILLTAFFWLPALTETDFVKINGVLDSLDFIDVTNTLRSLGEVFALPQTADPSQLQATVPITFHWILLILGVLGFFLPQPREKVAYGSVFGLHIFLYLVMAVVVFSQVLASADLWQSVRLLQYSQFAWRPMSIGSLVLALLAGIGASYLVRLLPTRFGKVSGMAVLVAGIILYSVPWLYRPQIDFNPNTVAEAQRYEVTSRQPVLSSYGEYLPAQTLQSALDTDRFQDNPDRLRSDDVVTVTQLEQSSIRLEATVEVTESTILTVDWLYVPGWRARVDEQIVEVMPIDEAGLVGFEIDAGTYNIELWYAGTMLQQGATFLSLVTIILVLLATWRMRPTTSPESPENSFDFTAFATFGVMGIALFMLKTQVIDTTDNILRNTRYEDGILQGVDVPLSVNFDDKIRLLGYDILEPVASGDSTEIRLYWALTNDRTNTDYSALVQLVDSQGIVIADASNFTIGGLATSNWLPNYYLQETVTLMIPQYTPPIAYDVVVGVYASANGTRLDILNSDNNNPIGIDASLDILQVERPAAETERQFFDRLLTFADLNLIEIDGFPETVQVGDSIEFSWVWQGSTSASLNPRILWDDTTFTEIDDLVVDYPLTEWQVNDVWRGYQRVIVPPTLPAGTYQPRMQVGDQSAPVNTPITITVPEREFDLPDLDVSLNQEWLNGIALTGYLIDDDALILYWQTDRVIDESLRLFVQWFDADGQLLVVRDGVPVDGARPTTSWIPNEVISTRYDLPDVPDNSTMLIGWYNPQTGERVLLDDASVDALSIDAP